MNLKDYKDEIEKCVKCGTCTSTCTVYKELLTEAVSTRGKLALVDAYLNGELELTDNLIDRLKKCTLCLKCAQQCPNGIRTDEIFFLFWSEIFKKKGLDIFKNTIFYKIMLNKNYIKLFSFFNRYFSVFVSTKNNLNNTQKFFFMNRNIPQLNYVRTGSAKLSLHKEKNTFCEKVGVFTGCLVDYCYPNITGSLIKVLAKNNIEAVIPEEQICCGAPFYTLGDLKQARELALANLELFKQIKVDKILTVCSTCLATLKHRYLWLLGDEAEKYKEVFDKFEDVSVYLNRLDMGARNMPEQGKKIYYHDSCHLKNAFNIYEEPRDLIKRKAGVDSISDSGDLCCGFGGSFNMDYYGLSGKICGKIIDKIKEDKPDIVLTSCPACIMQISDNLAKAKMKVKVKHLVEFLGE